MMGNLKHLPVEDWPKADIEAFAKAFEPGDIFDETGGPGAHLREGTRKMIMTAYRRWLGFLTEHDPKALLESPADRITRSGAEVCLSSRERDQANVGRHRHRQSLLRGAPHRAGAGLGVAGLHQAPSCCPCQP